MRSFKDVNGKDWIVDVNVPAVDKCRAVLAVDLLNVFGEDSVLAGLDKNLSLMAHVLYFFCVGADGRAPSDEREFSMCLKGNIFWDARDALWGAVADFFPLHQRNMLMEILAKADQLTAAAGKKVTEILNDPRFDASMERKLAELSGKLLGNSASTLPA